MIYSTNLSLFLNGGVGASLRSRYGDDIQRDLYKEFQLRGQDQASTGDVYITELPYTPWKLLFHTVAIDPYYHTDPVVVRKILKTCIDHSVAHGGIHRIITTMLGGGFGNLPVSTFFNVVEELLEDYHYSTIEELSIVCHDLAQLRELSARHGPTWEMIELEKPRGF